MKTKSAKAKGRVLQNWVKKKMLEIWRVPEEDIRCAIMGEKGWDVVLHKSSSLFYAYPFGVECKNQERLNVWSAWEQTMKHNEGKLHTRTPILFIKKNGKKPLVVMDAEQFFLETEYN